MFAPYPTASSVEHRRQFIGSYATLTPEQLEGQHQQDRVEEERRKQQLEATYQIFGTEAGRSAHFINDGHDDLQSVNPLGLDLDLVGGY